MRLACLLVTLAIIDQSNQERSLNDASNSLADFHMILGPLRAFPQGIGTAKHLQ